MDAAKAKQVIGDNIYINIATVTPDGKPWNTAVYGAYDEQYHFYWMSWIENQHSHNIRHSPNVFITIYNSTVSESSREGVYIQAQAYELTDPAEIDHALKYYYARKNKTPRPAQDFIGDSPRRMYKAVPEKVWLNEGSNIDGQYIDKRVEVVL